MGGLSTLLINTVVAGGLPLPIDGALLPITVYAACPVNMDKPHFFFQKPPKPIYTTRALNFVLISVVEKINEDLSIGTSLNPC